MCKQDENFPKEALSAQTESTQSPKKIKFYYVVIVIQQATFQGMSNQMSQYACKPTLLLTMLTTMCARDLIKKIELLLTNSYFDSEIIKLTFRNNKEDIERCVRTQIKNLSFLETYFNILFLEITELKFN